MDTNGKQRSRGRLVPAVTRAFDILEVFLSSGRSLSAPEIATMTGLPRTTVHELIQTLLHYSYLVADGDREHRFKLGPTVLRLGYQYHMGLDVAREGQSVAERISNRSGETVHVATLDGDQVLYVAKVDSTRTVRMVSHVGGRLPAHVTGVGKVLLAYLTPEELDHLIPADSQLVSLTENSITDPSQLRQELQTVREGGVAYEFRESNEDVGCVAAPVRDHTGHVVAAMSISQLMSHFGAEQRQTRAELVREGALELSQRLGWVAADASAKS